jgi:hypothetical protein
MNGIVYLVGTVVIITAAPPSSARARALPEVTENAPFACMARTWLAQTLKQTLLPHLGYTRWSQYDTNSTDDGGNLLCRAAAR